MTAPAPFIGADVDLRGLDYMPLLGNHLFGSEFNAAATDSEWRAALTLWWAAWNQVPAGSLPSDDIALCRLADLGRDLRSWRKLRERALHGFTLCSDGRLYHEFLCEQAVIAWGKRSKERQRKAEWRAAQAAKNGAQPTNVPVAVPSMSPGQSAGQDADVPAKGKGRDGTGRDGIKEEIPSNLSVAPPPSPEERAAGAALQASIAMQSAAHLPGIEPEPKAWEPPDCPHLAVLALWAEELPDMPQHLASQWRGTRASHLRARWRETALERKWQSEADGLAWLGKFFRWLRGSPFLMGKTTNRDGRAFEFELAWLVNPTNWAKCREGKYHG